MRKILFVCLGNICRSPTAEGVFRMLVERAQLSEQFEIDSAGVGGWHAGEPPDARMQAAASRRGYRLSGHARQVTKEDFDRFDLLVAMDQSNRDALCGIARSAHHKQKVVLLRDFEASEAAERSSSSTSNDVPDPYYGGPAGFDEVVSIVERCCTNLITALQTNALASARRSAQDAPSGRTK